MTSLWKKEGVNPDSRILSFTSGDDLAIDDRLIPYDVLGSIAHARGIEKIGIINAKESADLTEALVGIYRDWKSGGFSLAPGDEDVHTALERALTEKLGETGKKIHSGRSRNDQVLTALRLFMMEVICDGMEKLGLLARAACETGERYRHVLMPGYTHMQRAMPSTLAFWHAALAEGFADTLEAGEAVLKKLDRSPLGAAAGFGAPLALDREHTARLLGFSRVHVNAGAVQCSRGRLEAALLGFFVEAGRDVEKMAWDLLLFSSAEFGFAGIPEEFCTGSSIMPQKKNADVLELLRATPSVVLSCRDEIERVMAKLPPGYHRDLQLTKPPLFRGVEAGLEMIDISCMVLPKIEWNPDRMREACSIDILAAHRATDLVKEGAPFREAYRQAARELQEGETSKWKKEPADIIDGLGHLGAPGNPGLAEAEQRIEAVEKRVAGAKADLTSAWDSLLVGCRRS